MLRKIIVLSLILFLVLMGISTVNAAEDIQNSTITSTDSTQVTDTSLNVNANASNDLSYVSSSDVKSVNLKANKLSTTYGSGKYLKVKAIDAKTKKPVSNLKLKLKVYTGKKSKRIAVKTNSKGIAKYSASYLKVGKHKVIVNLKNSKILSKPKTTYVKISKAKLTISAPKVTNYYKKSKLFKVIIKNKESKKLMKNIKVKLKVYTGKKYKICSLKTNKKGLISINTKSLSKGSHKVLITIKSSIKNRATSKKSTIKIVKKPAQYIKLKVNGHSFNVKLEDNKATEALVNKLKKANITVSAEEYGNFEKVGDLGFSLPQSDKYISTSPGDIVLYDGDKISLFYNSNSWEYTKLGRIVNVDSNELRDILGSGDVKIILSLK